MGIVGACALGLILFGVISTFNSFSNDQDSSSIIVAIAPNNSYEYMNVGDDPISDERTDYLIKEAMDGKGDNITIDNGAIYGKNVTIKDLSLYGTPITLAYFKENNTPPFDGNTFSAIAKFSLVVSYLKLSASLIAYDVASGSLTKEEGEKKIKAKIETQLKDFKKQYPEVTVYWNY